LRFVPNWLEIAVGVVLLLATFYDLFQSVVLPRPAVNKLATVRYLLRGLWRCWRWVGERIDSIPRRETWLAAFGPVGVLTMFAFWGLALVLGYSLLIDGFRAGIEPVPVRDVGADVHDRHPGRPQGQLRFGEPRVDDRGQPRSQRGQQREALGGPGGGAPAEIRRGGAGADDRRAVRAAADRRIARPGLAVHEP